MNHVFLFAALAVPGESATLCSVMLQIASIYRGLLVVSMLGSLRIQHLLLFVVGFDSSTNILLGVAIVWDQCFSSIGEGCAMVWGTGSCEESSAICSVFRVC